MAASLPVNQGVVTQGNTGTILTIPATILTITSATNYLMLQNLGPSDMYFGFSGTTASTSGFLLRPGASIEFASFIPLGAISASSASTATACYLTA
jgi:hypothetical protein